jgi:N-acetylglucosamine-6-phosphate deacetylase
LSRRTITGLSPATGGGIAVEIEDGIVVTIREHDGADACYLAAGLIDLQVNGYGGIDLNDGVVTPARVSALARILLSLGVTTFLPTLVTAAEEAIVAGLRAIAEARASDPVAERMIPFVHVEGPFVSPNDGPRGAHPREFVRPPDLAEYLRWQKASRGLVGLVTLSPHDAAALDFVRRVASDGVHVALGHTDAEPNMLHAAAEAGARLSTHLGNGIGALLPRHPNAIWAQLADDRLTATFIADGHHLPADTLKAMLRAKGLARAILVSDSVALGGMPPGVYDQKIGGKVELTADGRLGTLGTPYLAGAARPLKDGVAFAANSAALSLSDALMLASGNPGRIVRGRGELAVGAPADLIRFRWRQGEPTLAIEQVLLRGEDIETNR